MYKIVLKCSDVEDADWDKLPEDIQDEFTQHRTWHAQVKCWHEDGCLFIAALNEFDSDGMALLDEFGDSVIANHSGLSGPISVVSVSEV